MLCRVVKNIGFCKWDWEHPVVKEVSMDEYIDNTLGQEETEDLLIPLEPIKS